MSEVHSGTGSDRRELLKKALVGSSLFTGAGLAAASAAAADDGDAGTSGRRRPIEFDVAVLGNTLRTTLADGASFETGDLYGTYFLIEGLMYPKGTIPSGAGFDPASRRHIGHWFCASTLMIGPRRGEPHLIGHQQYVFGRIGSRNLFPRNQIVSHGMEGANSPVTFIRAITGGSGRYAGLGGTVQQRQTGTNTTIVAQLGTNAENWRFKLIPA